MRDRVSPKELIAVGLVGLGLSFVGRRVRFPLLLGTGMYLAGYLARGYRPAGGWPLLDRLPDVPKPKMLATNDDEEGVE